MTKERTPIEEAIAAAFSSRPSYIFTTTDLVEMAFPKTKKITKRDRAAVLRAAKRNAPAMAWDSDRPDIRTADTVWFNSVDPRSIGLAHERCFSIHHHRTTEALDRWFDGHHAKYIAPGGVFWERAELRKAELAGDTKRAAKLRKKHEKDVEELMRLARGLTEKL